MFKIAADALGISDIGSVVKPPDYNKVDSDDYVMHEDGEKIFFLIKSRTDEYCFTNQALIQLDGTSAMSKKRTLRRFTYGLNPITEVFLETAGTIDLDIEIKFTMGGRNHSICVRKAFIAELKDLYKALMKISEIQHENNVSLGQGKASLEMAAQTLGTVHKLDGNVAEQFKAVHQYITGFKRHQRETYVTKDFGAVYEKFINN